jgi:cytochrome c2
MFGAKTPQPMMIAKCISAQATLCFFVLLSPLVSPSIAADVEHGRRVFAACVPCHAIESEHSTFGPSLGLGGQTGSITGRL